jgi:hypothetical protein
MGGTAIVDGLGPGRSITDRAVVRQYRSRNFACGFLLSEEDQPVFLSLWKPTHFSGKEPK